MHVLCIHACYVFFRYTPLKKSEQMPAPLPYDPIRCNGCSTVLNPFV